MGYPNSIIAGWLMENPINMDNLGGPPSVMACAAGPLYNSSCSCFLAFLQLLLGTVSHFYGCLLYSTIVVYLPMICHIAKEHYLPIEHGDVT